MTPVRLMKPYISFEEVEAEFREVFASGMFTRGEHVEAFRKELAAFTGAKHVHMATSATTALWVCLKMLQIGPGDEVVQAGRGDRADVEQKLAHHSMIFGESPW